MLLKKLTKALTAGICLAALAGCSADDVQLNGKIFDAVGLNNTGSVQKVPKLRERQALVVPPGLEKLPEPGAAAVGQDQAALAEVRDYDEARTIPQAELQRQQDEYCAKHYDLAKARGDQDYVLASGPLGSCHKSALSLVEGFGGGSNQAPAEE